MPTGEMVANREKRFPAPAELRGRIVAARGVKADQLKPSVDSEWVLQSDRGLTYSPVLPKGSSLTQGQWWAPDYNGPPLVSVEELIA